MRNTLEEIVLKYSHGDTELESVKIDEEHFKELLIKYLNDKNSSTLRQDVMCEVAGVKSNPNKLGYDGEDTTDEMKPKNVRTTNPKLKKLDGCGNYTDMTFKRHKAFYDQDAKIHVGGFIDGEHVFQLSVPYREMSEHFENQLKKRLPNGDQPTQYLRSMNFSLTQIKKCKNVSLTYITQKLESYRGHITKPLYTYLTKLQEA
jgi:hypothetical protein